jgi:hypothetical protein
MPTVSCFFDLCNLWIGSLAMKSIILFLLIAAPFPFASGQEPYVSRFGVIQIKADEEVFQYEAQSIEIAKILKGTDRDYIIVAINSGGIACPIQLVIIELSKSAQPKVSKDFGSCTETTSARLVNDRVIIETPSYAAHPELLSKKELRRRERTKEVYTWYKGKLTKRIESR